MLPTEPRIEIPVTGPPPYSVQVGWGLLQELHLPQAPVALLYPSDLPEALVQATQQSLKPQLSLALPPREACKTIPVFAEVLSKLAQANFSRQCAVVGLGGGAMTDLAGYVAASYLRGVAFYALPTTLLGMVDAALGGKTGLNLPEGKNLVGAFWPPRGVCCDLEALETLPPALFREGAAEVFKHGLLNDPSLLARVLDPAFRPGSERLLDTVADAIAVKAQIVSRDLTEQGERAFLNLGHTLAHALEAVTQHALPHGEAVAYGLDYAARLSLRLGGADLRRYTQDFLRWQAPQPLPALAFEQLLPFLARDKKADEQGVRFVLLHDLAQPYLARVSLEVVREEWQRALEDWGAAKPAH